MCLKNVKGSFMSCNVVYMCVIFKHTFFDEFLCWAHKTQKWKWQVVYIITLDSNFVWLVWLNIRNFCGQN